MINNDEEEELPSVDDEEEGPPARRRQVSKRKPLTVLKDKASTDSEIIERIATSCATTIPG